MAAAASPRSGRSLTSKTGLRSTKTISVDDLVKRRIQTLQHFRRAYEGDAFYLNLLKFPSATHDFDPDNLSALSEQWFVLGITIGNILGLGSGARLARALFHILEELDHRFSSNNTPQPIMFQIPRPMRSRGLHSKSASTIKLVSGRVQTGKSGTSSSKTSFAFSKKRCQYEYLDTSNIPCEIGHAQAVIGLCDVLALVYARFADGSCENDAIVEKIAKIDDRIKEVLVKPVSVSLKKASYEILKNSFNQINWRFRLGRRSLDDHTDVESSRGKRESTDDFRSIFKT